MGRLGVVGARRPCAGQGVSRARTVASNRTIKARSIRAKAVICGAELLFRPGLGGWAGWPAELAGGWSSAGLRRMSERNKRDRVGGAVTDVIRVRSLYP
jgi:hypothetical protein